MYHWIQTDQLDRDLGEEAVSYKPRLPAAWKPDPFKGIIQVRLEIYPRLTARRRFEVICADGHLG